MLWIFITVHIEFILSTTDALGYFRSEFEFSEGCAFRLICEQISLKTGIAIDDHFDSLDGQNDANKPRKHSNNP